MLQRDCVHKNVSVRLRFTAEPRKAEAPAAGSVSTQIFLFQIADHLHIARLAALIAAGQQVLITRGQILLADVGVGRMAV